MRRAIRIILSAIAKRPQQVNDDEGDAKLAKRGESPGLHRGEVMRIAVGDSLSQFT